MAGLIGVRVKVDTSRLQGVISRLPGAADKAAEMTADEIVVRAKALARVDTGEMRDSIQKVGGGSIWAVIATAAHSIFNEYGTRFMSAQPFMVPAAEAVNMSDIILQFYRMCDL